MLNRATNKSGIERKAGDQSTKINRFWILSRLARSTNLSAKLKGAVGCLISLLASVGARFHLY